MGPTRGSRSAITSPLRDPAEAQCLADVERGYLDLVNDFERSRMEAELRRRLIAIGPTARAELLRALNLPSAEPATLIGALYPRELPLRNRLTQLQHDLPTLGAVVAELRRMEHEDNQRSACG